MKSSRGVYLIYVLSLFAALLLQMVQLPEFLAGARPMWLPLVVSYWALTEPRVSALMGAFLMGIASDVLFASVLGEHSLALVLVAAWVTQLRRIFSLFPLWQATLAMIPTWAGYSFVLFWIDGATSHQADALLRWLPVISTTLFWPLIYAMMEVFLGRREREE